MVQVIWQQNRAVRVQRHTPTMAFRFITLKKYHSKAQYRDKVPDSYPQDKFGFTREKNEKGNRKKKYANK